MLRLLLCGLACAVLLAQPASADTLYYPAPEGRNDERADYGFALLQLALKKAGGQHVAVLSPVPMQQNRAIAELTAGTGKLRVLSTMTSHEREQQLLPVRIPITRGLLGWRVALVRGSQRELFRETRSLKELGALRGAQGHDWPDLAILRAAGLQIDAVSSYPSLFSMLDAKRIDYVPRAVFEVGPEAGLHPQLAADPYLLLRYPAADYFFVNRKDQALADTLRRGLEKALDDGSFEKLLYSYYGSSLRALRLERRRIIDLPNPLLPPGTPLQRKELWFSLDELRRHQ